MDSEGSDLDARFGPKNARKNFDKGNVKGGKEKRVGVREIFNDWDLLLPSTDPYVDEDDDDELNDDEKWKKRQLSKKGWESSRGQAILLMFLVAIAVFVRIWKLAVPGAVVFDEQHFGGFAGDYLKGEFFMDIHPPLGKMLYAAVAYMLGFNGDFEFIPGRLYTKNIPYIGMRMFAVACGVGLIPISYLTIKRSGHSTQAAMICAILITFENALVTQSRLILLDAPMMLFMGYTMLAWINFYNHRNRPFTRGWWFWLLQTGFSLFLSSSVKWVGLFTIATVGVCVLKYLQESRTHLYISTRDFSKQFVALFFCLLILPGVLYIGLHALDFRLLSNSGSGNAWVSPQFQMTLKGHDVLPVMADIAWNSRVHIRHANTNGGWVHTMPGEHTREGSKEQAVQLVEWDDDLTCWQIYPADPHLHPSIEFDGFVYDGDQIRLRHCYSKVALSTNDIESLGSNKTFLREVSGAKWSKHPTEEAIWRVELQGQEQRKKDKSKQWHSIKGFRLWNEKRQCYLQSHKVFRAPYSTYQEVGCIQGGRQKANTIFIVDQNVNSHLPKSTPSLSYQPLSFFQKFLELNRVMWWTHHDLSAPGFAESSPWSWPLLRRGINYYSSRETNHYVHFMGNPLLWWAASAAVAFYMLSCVWSVIKYLKGKDETKFERDRFVASGTFYAGWAIHYIPFFFMSRQVFLHHYLPALYFSILLLVSRLDRTWQRWPARLRYLTGIALMAAVMVSWYSFAPFAYGTDFGSRAKCERLRTMGGWTFTCH
ncbi:Dolichyl-phosphate-mannose-protein mannosyltransferase-domain-containing protein, partial [Dissophora ornata]